jgi:ParB family chromosome partitioning protein
VSEQLTLKYIPLTQAKRWDRNPKKHDIGAICRSIELHGFRDPPAYDAALDGFAEGNGRTDALEALWQQKRPAPAYIAVDSAGVWHLPVIFGADSASRAAAEAYGIDHNNLTMSGGDFAAWDIAKLWNEEEYTTLLKELAEADMMPVSMDGDDLDALLGGMNADWAGAMGALPEGDRAPFQQMTFTLSDEQAEAVKRALRAAQDVGPFVGTGNENSNGNALARICEAYDG